MRNAMIIGEEFVVTTDNSGGIGEKKQDVVHVPDQLTAYYSARVALLEQWAAQAEPTTILLHNFSGEESWGKYVQGITTLLEEAGVNGIPISGSTETNMPLLQSAMAVTMIGKRQSRSSSKAGQWFLYGRPLVGEEVIQQQADVASIQKLRQALDARIIHRIWPIGSKGILHEVHQLLKDDTLQINIEDALDLYKTAGPSTAVLVKVPISEMDAAKQLFGQALRPVIFQE